MPDNATVNMFYSVKSKVLSRSRGQKIKLLWAKRGRDFGGNGNYSIWLKLVNTINLRIGSTSANNSLYNNNRSMSCRSRTYASRTVNRIITVSVRYQSARVNNACLLDSMILIWRV